MPPRPLAGAAAPNFRVARRSPTADLELRNRKPGVPLPAAPDAHCPRPNRFEANKKFYGAAAHRVARSFRTAKSGIPLAGNEIFHNHPKTRDAALKSLSKLQNPVPSSARIEKQALTPSRPQPPKRNSIPDPRVSERRTGSPIFGSENSLCELKAGLRSRRTFPTRTARVLTALRPPKTTPDSARTLKPASKLLPRRKKKPAPPARDSR